MFDAAWIQRESGGRWITAPSSGLAISSIGIDTREDLRGKAFLAIKGERFDGHDFLPQAVNAGAELLIVQESRAAAAPKTPVPILVVDDARSALGRLAAAHRRRLASLKVIAVTGSSGKTTTKRLIDSVLSKSFRGNASPKSFNNDIGVPLTLLSALENHQYLVAEIGMNHPGEIAALAKIAAPDLGVITMVGSAHLAGLGSLDAIAAEKASLIHHIRPDGVAIVHADSAVLCRHLDQGRRIVRFGESSDADPRIVSRTTDESGQWITLGDGFRFRLNIPGRHNASNALAAIAVGREMGLSDEQIAAGLNEATPAPMRLERRMLNGVELFNDAYNANPESMAAAIETFGEITAKAPRRIVILGDMLELGPTASDLHATVGRRVAALHRKTPIALFIAVGGFSSPMAAPVIAATGPENVMIVPELTTESCRAIADRICHGDRILLKASRGTALERLIPFLTPAETATA